MRYAVSATGSMNGKPDRSASIRRRLLALLVAPVTIVLLSGTVSDYVSVTNPIRDVYDQELANDAVAMSFGIRVRARTGRVSVRVPAESETLLRSDPADKVYFGIVGEEGELLAGDPD